MVANISTQSHGHANYNEVIITEIKSHINLPALLNFSAASLMRSRRKTIQHSSDSRTAYCYDNNPIMICKTSAQFGCLKRAVWIK